MNPELARKTIVETFRQKFDDARFLYFIRNLVNHLDETKRQTWTLKKAAFEDFVNHFARLGTYTDADGEAVDVLVIHLRKDTTLARGRVTLRNFVADYLATGHGQGKAAVMAAFVSPIEDDWRFSFVKLDYTFEKTDLGFVAERIQLTPARRYSYLVGKNENCHTAQKQFLALLETHEINPTVAQLEAAFSVEKVTREFYDHYKDLFEQTRDAMAAFLDSAPKIKTHFAERGIECDDFAKKLLGQIVFLYFLQKKGWFGVERGKTWGSGRKDFIRHLFNNRADYAHIPGQRKRPANFFNDILEPLFYEAIAAPRTDEDHYYSRFDCKIPFLNGGLFEPLYGYNWVETEILLPDTLFANDQPTQEKGETGTGILDVFDRYNFTVNEAEPLEKEVAVDPEMLGLVFENLLPENVRHSSGTFYTPRVIVHYMCQQALLHYLTVRAADIPQADLALFLRLAERFTDFQAKETKKHADKRLPESIRNNAARLDELLATITVCDPAIGSGAFPVGMMLEICRARMALAAVEGMPEQTFYHLKRHAIQHSLYGVDLDPGAVEIAKLRLWLSMVVDEDNITDIQPLPNLDYKIMQGNSLLEEFDGVRLLDDKLLQPPAASRESEIADLKNRISAASQEFVRLHGEGKKSAAAKLATEQEIKRLKKQLAGLVHPDEAKPDGQGELNQQTSWASLKRIQELHSTFFDEDSRAEKDKLRRELDGLEWNFMEATLRESGREAALAELKRASATHRKPFFLWRLHFGEVFQKRGGFDVVIANPPYVRHEEIKEFKPAFKRTFECYTGIADLFVYFYERSVKLLRDGGALALITSNKYYRASYGEKLRGFLVRELTLQQLIDFGDAPVFEAVAYASILTGLRVAPTKNSAAFGYTWEADLHFDRIAQIIPERGQQIRQDELKPDGWRLESPAEMRLLEKLRRTGKPLREFVGARVSRGLTTGLNEAFVVDRDTRDRLIREHKSSAEILKPYMRGKDIDRWRAEFADQFVVKIESSENKDHPWSGKSEKDAEKLFAKTYPAIYSYFENFRSELIERADQGKYFWEQRSCKYWQEFEKPKIVSTKISIRPTFALDSERRYLGNTAYFFPAAASGHFLLGLLNSSLFSAYAKKVFAEKQGGWFEVQPDGLESFPIPNVSPEIQKPVERLVGRILAAKAQDASADVSDSEHELNTLVYALYGLTPEEIELVKGVLPEKKQPTVVEHALPKGKRITLGGVKYAIQLVQALLTESADGLTWPRLVDAFTLATQPSLMAQEAASADAAKILAWTKRWNETLPPGALVTAIEQLGADNLAVTKSGSTLHISLKTARPKTSAEDVNYDAWLALRTLGPAPEIQLAAPVFATPNFAVWTQTIEALAA
jgi:type I restriction-modification system DNA methylase subunit